MEHLVLHAALEKIRESGDGPSIELTPDETLALRTYLTELVSKADRTEPEDLLCRHIRGVLQSLAFASRKSDSEDESFRRTNLALREAIDRFQERRFSDLDRAQLALLQDTLAKLIEMEKIEEPSPNQVRLKQLIGDCLDSYERWLAEEPVC